ncbi:KH domain-containing protein HEN4 isoform X4 [Ricinus communis]|uniref:KH domain-containing protein HEN4 isoform X4 n=1 Tax=Ricinus communis TaxID=3988 RepID=UPI00201B181A|nr:KH domain-containing protein HEN4 isoform X4 [Ricinus communis]
MMGSNFLYPPSKRPIQYNAAGMPDPNPTANGLSNKRPKQPPANQNAAAPLPLPPGHVSFRLLCHASRIGGIIGKSGTIIKQLQQQSGAKIRIEESPAESSDRVITVIAEGQIVSKVRVESEEVDVSRAQEGLIRVFERILEVAAESDGINVVAGGGGVVSCRMLAGSKQAGSVIGKGGKVVEKIRKDCGVKIRVLTDKLPVCAGPNEEMIEIEGDILSVKKALIAVSRCLQDCQPVDKPRVGSSKYFEAVPQEPLPEMRVEIAPQRNIMVPTMQNNAVSCAPVPHNFLLETDRVPSLDMKLFQQEVVFKILCPNDMVGGVIGKGGTIIKALQNETGASITIGATIAESDERLITVIASENPESRYSAAQKAVVLVFSRSVEAGTEKGLDSSSGKGFPFAARLVVPSNQVGCLLGKGGIIISDMRKTTGTSIKILAGDQLPKCVPENEQVVQISGDFMNVKDAVYHVTGRLRDNLFSSALSTPVTRSTTVITEASPYGRLKEPLRDAFKEPLNTFREPLGDAFRDPLRAAMRGPLRDARRDPLRDSFGDTLRDQLRDTLKEPPRGPAPYNLHPPIGVSHSLNRHNTLTQSMDHLGLSHSLDGPISPRLWASQTMAGINPRVVPDASRGFTSFKGGLELGSGSKSAIVTNTTVEIRVPENVIGSVYGENDSNLTRLRQRHSGKWLFNKFVRASQVVPGSIQEVVVAG